MITRIWKPALRVLLLVVAGVLIVIPALMTYAMGTIIVSETLKVGFTANDAIGLWLLALMYGVHGYVLGRIAKAWRAIP